MLMSRLKNGFSWEQYRDATIDLMMQHPFSFESDKDIFDRGQAFKKFIRAYLESNPLPEGEKLAVVCHSKFMCALNASHAEP